jgi:hypothetical protein
MTDTQTQPASALEIITANVAALDSHLGLIRAELSAMNSQLTGELPENPSTREDNVGINHQFGGMAQGLIDTSYALIVRCEGISREINRLRAFVGDGLERPTLGAMAIFGGRILAQNVAFGGGN